MTKAESKYFNTAQRMDEAFMALMEKKDFEYITVKEICEKAGVNRSTFYLHYETIGDLLDECVDRMNRQFATYFSKTHAEFKQNISSAPLEQLFLITPEYLVPYLTFISEHKTVFKVVLAKPEAMLAKRTYDTLLANILDLILERYGVMEKDRDYYLSFYITGITGIIKRWLQMDCKDPVDDIARIIMLVIRR